MATSIPASTVVDMLLCLMQQVWNILVQADMYVDDYLGVHCLGFFVCDTSVITAPMYQIFS
jgi:hypothetical protein